MISKYSHKGLNWIDIEQPKDEEILYIFDEYAIPIFIKEEIILKNENDIVRLDHNFIFVSFNFYQILIDRIVPNKLTFVVSDNFIITIHNKPIDYINEFLKELELNTINNEIFQINNNPLLFAHLLKSFYISSQKQVIACDNKIKNLKKQSLINIKLLKMLLVLSLILLGAIIAISIYVFKYI